MSHYPKEKLEFPGTMNYPRADFDLSVSRDEIPSVSFIGKFGSHDDAGTGKEIIWSGAAVASSNPFPTSAAKVKVRAGGNAADTLLGTGGQKITIQGIDANWDLVTEDIDLAGAAESGESSNEYFRVVRIQVTSGSGGVNVGNITLDQVGGQCIAHVKAGNGQTTQAFFSIPRNHDGYIVSIEANVDANKRSLIQTWRRYFANTATPSERIAYEFFGVVGEVHASFRVPKHVPEYTDVYVSSTAGALATGVSAMFDVILVRNGD